ncbi:MAG: hypothetical protein ACYSTL_07975 [Planctomycetota bacterium]
MSHTAALAAASLSTGAGASGGEKGVRTETALEDQLTRMLLERPPVPVTKSREAPPESPATHPLPHPFAERRCRIEYSSETGWYRLTFLARPPGEYVRYRWILPSQLLAEIEPIIQRTPGAVFYVSGEPTTYKDREFVMLVSASVEHPAARTPEPPPAAPEPQKPSPAAPEPAKLTDVSAPDPGDSASQDVILQQLLRRRPAKPVVVPYDPVEVTISESVAPAAGRPQLDEDRGDMRIDRLVTVVFNSEEQWWEARFRSDNTLQDQPIRLLPCKLLEDAEKTTTSAKRITIPVRITGEVTRYKGREYLLLRKVLRERDMGQF